MNQERIIIIGAGVSGITTGLVLQLFGYPTVIYAKNTIDNFNCKGDPAFASRYPAASIIPHTVYTDNLERLFRQSQSIFYRLRKACFKGLTLHKHFEVFEFEREQPPYLEWMFNVRSIEQQNDLPRRKETDKLFGWVFDCFFTDWPVYFPRLTQLYLKSGGQIHRQKLTSGDIPKLPSDIIVNCSGLGSCDLFEDDSPHEIGRGHLLHIKDAPIYRNSEHQIISYNYTPKADVYSDDNGDPVDVYWYPRKDGWILGGSRQFGTIDNSGKWNGGEVKCDSYTQGDISYPKQILDLNKKILKESYGLELETYQDISAFKGYRYIRSRKNGLRLESEILNKKTIIHNYGHGGAGITLSWGAALGVARMAASVRNRTVKTKIKSDQNTLKKLQNILKNSSARYDKRY